MQEATAGPEPVSAVGRAPHEQRRSKLFSRSAQGRLQRYGVALALTLAALFLAFGLRLISQRLPGSPFFAAVAISAWYGGFGPALLAAVLGLLALDYFFISPTYFLRLDAPNDIISLATFLLIALLVSSLSANLRRARELAEAARAEAEAARDRTTRTLESISDAFSSFNRDWRYTYVNQRASQLTGKAPDELIGRRLWDVFPQVVGTAFERECRRAVAEQAPVHFEYRIQLLHAWFEVQAYPSPYGVSVHLRDITDRKRSEDALTLLAEIGRQLADSLDEQTAMRRVARLVVPALSDIAIVDVQEQDGSLRQAAVAHVDEGKEALLQEPHRDYAQPTPTRYLAEVLRTRQSMLLAKIPESGAPATDDARQLDLLTPVGARSLIVVPLVAHGRTLGTVSLARIEGSPAFDARDLELAEQLGRRAGVAVDNLRLYEAERSARALAQEALASRDEFIAIVTHDLRSPLTSIKGYAQFMQRRGAYDERGIEAIVAGANHLDRLIGDLAEASRLASAQIELKRQKIDLGQFVDSAVHRLGEQGGMHVLRVEAPAEPVFGWWDPDRLEQVLQNLLSNAVKYSPDGGEVLIQITHLGDQAQVSIRDHGIGIPPEALPQLFDRFYRAAGTTMVAEGLGLGLYIARMVVEGHGGRIWAESEGLGSGSAFSFSLPYGQPTGEN